MARHRDGAATRGLSRGPVIAVVLVVALVLLTLGWFQLRSTSNQEGQDAAATCVDGDKTVDVAADPDVAAALAGLAATYDDSHPVVRDQCVHVAVHPLDSSAVLAGLQGTWDTATLGPRPSAWVAQDTGFTRQLAAAGLDGDPTSIASSPLVLAVPQDAGPAVTAAGLTWGQLPAVAATAGAWSKLGQPSWGSLSVALPTGPGTGSRPTASSGTLAPELAQAVASGLNGGAALDRAALPAAVTTALAGLGSAVRAQPASTAAALTALGRLSTVPGSAYQAVPATEQQVLTAAQAAPGTLSAAVLTGGAPAEDYPFAVLAGTAVDDTSSRAAAAFQELVSSPQGQDALGRAGFRTPDGAAPADGLLEEGGASTEPAPAPLRRVDAATASALTAALRAPVVSSRALVALNVSTSTAEPAGSTTRLRATTAAVAARLQQLPATASVGLTTFSRGQGGSTPYAATVAPAVLTAAQRTALTAALGSLQPTGATSASSVLIAAYADAVRGYAAGVTNRLLVVTDGANDNGGTSSAGVRAAVTAAMQAGRPVRVDVIVLNGADVGALTDMAELTGGTVTAVAGASTGEMTAALATLLP